MKVAAIQNQWNNVISFTQSYFSFAHNLWYEKKQKGTTNTEKKWATVCGKWRMRKRKRRRRWRRRRSLKNMRNKSVPSLSSNIYQNILVAFNCELLSWKIIKCIVFLEWEKCFFFKVYIYIFLKCISYLYVCVHVRWENIDWTGRKRVRDWKWLRIKLFVQLFIFCEYDPLHSVCLLACLPSVAGVKSIFCIVSSFEDYAVHEYGREINLPSERWTI